MIEHVRLSYPESITPVTCEALVKASCEEHTKMPGTSLGVMRGPSWASLKQRSWDWAPYAHAHQWVAEAFIRQLPPEILALRDFYRQSRTGHGFETCDVQIWHTQLYRGGEIGAHDHRMALWSGAFYPEDIEEGAAGGLLCFGSVKHWMPVIPRAGLLVTFPPTLNHWVSVYEGARPRLSISMNLHWPEEQRP